MKPALASVLLLALAGAAHAETLEEALAMAYSTNPQLTAERARLRATDEQVAQALSGWRPTVQIVGTGGLARQSTDISGSTAGTTVTLPGGTASTVRGGSGTAYIRSHSYELQVSQPVYSGGRTVAQTAQAENLVRAERATLANVEETVLLNAATAYFDVLRDQTLLQLQVDNEQILHAQLRAVQAQIRAGTALDTDVQLAQSRLSTAIAQRETAEGNLGISRETYRQVVGQAPKLLAPVPGRPALPTSIDEARRLASMGNPAVVAAGFTRAAALDAVKVVRSQLLPTLSVNGTASRSVDSESVTRTSDDLSVTAQVAVPLYESGSVYSQTREAQQTVAQRTAELDTARRQVVQTAGTAWESLRSARAAIASNSDAVAAEAAALRGIQAQYQAGTRSIIDVLNEQQVLLNNRINLAVAQRNEAAATFQLVSAIGRLTAIDLALPVELYDADRNYRAVREKWFGFETPP